MSATTPPDLRVRARIGSLFGRRTHAAPGHCKARGGSIPAVFDPCEERPNAASLGMDRRPKWEPILARALSGGDRRGSALLVTMLTAVLLSGLAGALVVVLSTEEAVEANHRRGVVALYAADGLLAAVVAELAIEPDWQSTRRWCDGYTEVVLSGSRRSTFSTGPIRVPLADGSVISLRQETLDLQRTLEQRAGGVGVPPRWRLYAWGWFADLVHETDRGRLMYVAAWVRDDLADPDADPGRDTNGQVVVRADPRSARFAPGVPWTRPSAASRAPSAWWRGVWCGREGSDPTGDRSQETGVRRQESGDRSQENAGGLRRRARTSVPTRQSATLTRLRDAL